MQPLSMDQEEGVGLLPTGGAHGTPRERRNDNRGYVVWRQRFLGAGQTILVLGWLWFLCGDIGTVLFTVFIFFAGCLVLVAAATCMAFCCAKYCGRNDPKAMDTDLRVKSLDFHPSEPWLIAGLYRGHVVLWDLSFDSSPPRVLHEIRVSEHPVRCAKFINECIVTASDDGCIRVFNQRTARRIVEYEAHMDFIRYLEVHPSSPYFLSASDDMTIKLWDAEYNFACTTTFDEHDHYVMQVKFCPQDPNMFASASLDRTIKLWNVDDSEASVATLRIGHERGVNCIDFGHEPYLVSGGDDHRVILWDYRARQILRFFDGHTHNVNAVLMLDSHWIVSASEDGTTKVWDLDAPDSEPTSYDYQMGRCWALATSNGNHLARGFDDGCLCVDFSNNNVESSHGTTLEGKRVLLGLDSPQGSSTIAT